ncbi:GrpB family protein [Acrocarpospora catenulata]|uniref:GrpB family protein n=1 Tax=Acrocarpospora catenulata TaxID=2836182 RepID=UPI001BDB06A0|nr:GrpB family protein [Acrocarpospora catenulata]
MLTEYSTEWEDLYREIHDRLRTELAGLDVDIEPVGSRLVPGIYAKPVLDIMIRVPYDTRDKVDQVIIDMGLKKLAIAELDDRVFYRRWTSSGNPDLHIHIVNDEQWRTSHERHFRAQLLANHDLALSYSHMKRLLQTLSNGDPTTYNEAKTDFLTCLDTILSRFPAIN